MSFLSKLPAIAAEAAAVTAAAAVAAAGFAAIAAGSVDAPAGLHAEHAGPSADHGPCLTGTAEASGPAYRTHKMVNTNIAYIGLLRCNRKPTNG